MSRSLEVDASAIHPVEQPVPTAAVHSEIDKWQAEARSNFGTFRLLINPGMLTN
jgi:hypothetical protein